MIAACYPTLQDLILEVRGYRRDGAEEVRMETIRTWEEKLMSVDKVIRDRLFILTIAAERGWRVATDVSFNMKGRFLENYENCQNSENTNGNICRRPSRQESSKGLKEGREKEAGS